ncbi:MAG: type II toxin-antitoxin system prevent-host-death family antitoxin [Bryobacterales bacterium]
MVKKVNALKARHNLGQLLEEVYYRGDQYVIERAGRPMAAVVPLWQLDEWQKRRERFFEAVEGVWRKNRSASPRTVEREVAGAVKKVRGGASKKKS